MLTHHKLNQQKALPARSETTHGGELLSRIVALLNKF
jgi:hypothetical protein